MYLVEYPVFRRMEGSGHTLDSQKVRVKDDNWQNDGATGESEESAAYSTTAQMYRIHVRKDCSRTTEL